MCRGGGTQKQILVYTEIFKHSFLSLALKPKGRLPCMGSNVMIRKKSTELVQLEESFILQKNK